MMIQDVRVRVCVLCKLPAMGHPFVRSEGIETVHKRGSKANKQTERGGIFFFE
jgi:hypothetical protein